jgi:hypothetical protein
MTLIKRRGAEAQSGRDATRRTFSKVLFVVFVVPARLIIRIWSDE